MSENRFVIHTHAARERLQPPSPMIHGLIPQQGTGLLFGGWGSYKSFVAIGAAFAIAAGKPAYNSLPVARSGAVVYLAGEGYPDLAKCRLPAIFAAHKVAGDKIPFGTVDGVPEVRVAGEADALVKQIRETYAEPPALVVIDPLARAMAGLNENDACDAARYLEFTEAVARELNCFVLSIGHTGKDEKKGLRGSVAFEAGVDVIWQTTRTAPGKVELTNHKNKSGNIMAPLKLRGVPIGVAPNASLVFILDTSP